MSVRAQDRILQQAFGLRAVRPSNPWFQLLFLGLIPMKSQASTNSVLRPCPRSEQSKMRTVRANRTGT